MFTRFCILTTHLDSKVSGIVQGWIVSGSVLWAALFWMWKEKTKYI